SSRLPSSNSNIGYVQ
ncbi:unnamed protein product, partial [Callosobruchus maculatus]